MVQLPWVLLVHSYLLFLVLKVERSCVVFVVSIMCVCVHARTHAHACVLFLVQQHTKIHVDLPILCSCNGSLIGTLVYTCQGLAI